MSRQKRFEKVLSQLEDPKTEIECLRDELQDWLEGMPENLQSSDKADRLQEAIDNLESIIGNFEDIEGIEVEFPGMFG